MKWTGWIFFAVSWGVVLYWTGWCIYRVLLSRKHWTHPEEDIRELHHGEFGEKSAASSDPTTQDPIRKTD